MDNINEILEKNRQIITDYIQVHPDDTFILDASIKELIEKGVGTINTIEIDENHPWNHAMLLTNDEGNTFYLELSEHGTIVLLAKENSNGEVIQALLSNDVSVIEEDTNR